MTRTCFLMKMKSTRVSLIAKFLLLITAERTLLLVSGNVLELYKLDGLLPRK